MSRALPVLDDALLERPLQGRNLSARTLRELGQEGETLLVFLRHYG